MNKNLKNIALVGPGGRKKIKDILKNIENYPSDMTEEQKTEVRKNLGLYYEETSVGEKTAQYNNEPESATIPGFAKISNDVPSKNDLIELVVGVTHFNPITDGANIVDDLDGYYIQSRYGAKPILFRIVINDGIYINLSESSELPMALVYKGEITTVSKIDAKFLPEQESGIEPVTLLQVPTGSISNAVISDYISDEDWNKLINGETFIAKYNGPSGEHRYFLVTLSEISIMSAATITFVGIDRSMFTISKTGNIYNIWAEQNSGVYSISRFPTDGMSSEELHSIGFNNTDLIKFGRDIKTIKAGNDTATIISFKADNMDYTVEFWSFDNIYVLTGNLIGTTLACTVTSRA